MSYFFCTKDYKTYGGVLKWGYQLPGTQERNTNRTWRLSLVEPSLGSNTVNLASADDGHGDIMMIVIIVIIVILTLMMPLRSQTGLDSAPSVTSTKSCSIGMKNLDTLG